MPQAAIPYIMASAAAVGAGASIYNAMNQPGAPKVQTPTELQSAKAPDATSVRNALAGPGQGGGAQGIAQTFLSGAGGVNPALLQLGSNTLLGGGTGATSSMPPTPGMG